MELAAVMTMLCALSTAVARTVPVEQKYRGPHHSTKKELKEPPQRLPRKTKTQSTQSTDLDPALAYALPPVGLLHQGRGFGYGLGQGYEAAALSALLGQELASPGRRPVYHAAPVEQLGLLAQAHETPVEEPKQDEHNNAIQTAQAVQEQAVNFVHSPKYYAQDTHEDEYKDYAAKYQFGYRVRDLHTGNDFGQTESRDGHLTQGHYHVLLPDGRLQNVQYWSDHSGFHAKVSYDGLSHHH